MEVLSQPTVADPVEAMVESSGTVALTMTLLVTSMMTHALITMTLTQKNVAIMIPIPSLLLTSAALV